MRSFVAAFLLLTCAAFAQNDSSCANAPFDQSTTLSDVLKAACISPDDIAQSQSKAESQITSFAVLNTTIEFVIAYYERQENSDVLTPPLHVLRFIRKPKRWIEANLLGSKAPSNLLPDAACGARHLRSIEPEDSCTWGFI